MSDLLTHDELARFAVMWERWQAVAKRREELYAERMKDAKAFRWRKIVPEDYDLSHEMINLTHDLAEATPKFMAHIDALQAALKATYDADCAAWVVERPDPLDAHAAPDFCAFCGANYAALLKRNHKPDCKGEALKAALGLGKDGE